MGTQTTSDVGSGPAILSYVFPSHDLQLLPPLLLLLLLMMLVELLPPLILTTPCDFALNADVVLSLTNEQTIVIVH